MMSTVEMTLKWAALSPKTISRRIQLTDALSHACHTQGPRLRICDVDGLHFISSLALVYKALPCADLPLMATNPFRPRALRAPLMASDQALRPFLTKAFLALSDAARETTLPFLFFLRSDLTSPPPVLPLVPEKTRDLAPRPRATLDLPLRDFITFMKAMMGVSLRNSMHEACLKFEPLSQ